MKTIRIGTRGSALALAQTAQVEAALRESWPDVRTETVILHTRGDRILDKPLSEIGEKGLFVSEFESALMEGRIDLAVHSAKDLPLHLMEGLKILAVLPRADVRDVLVTRRENGACPSLASLLPDRPVIGTGSGRRQLYMEKLFPGARCRLIRGNVNTRLEKLWEGQYDGIVLAAAGLERLGLMEKERERFRFTPLSCEACLPAACQGIIAVEGRADWEDGGRLAKISHLSTQLAFETERRVLQCLEADCSEPAAAWCRLEQGPDGERVALTVMSGGRQESGVAPVAQRLALAEELSRVVKGKEREAGKERETGKESRQEKQGKVYLVGAGCGEPELITVKGIRLLQECETVLYDSLSSPELLAKTRPGCEQIDVGKRFGKKAVPQEEINRLLIEKAREGRTVVRLKGGDPYVFGRGGEEMLALMEAGIACEEVPGITSAIAVPAAAGIPVTHRQVSRSVTILTASALMEDGRAEGLVGMDYAALGRIGGTLVILMGMHHLPELASRLMEGGMAPGTPVAVIMEGATVRQRSVRAPLGEIADKAMQAGLEAPAVIVVGEAASMQLNGMFSEKGSPLLKARIGVTGTEGFAGRLASRLSQLGAKIVDLAFLHTVSTKGPLPDFTGYSWLVFTSPNGVAAFFEKMKQGKRDMRSLSGMKLAVIGPGTAGALEEHGLYAELMPEQYDAGSLGRALAARMAEGERALLVRASKGSRELVRELEEKGRPYLDFPLYALESDEEKRRRVLETTEGWDYILFGSASGVRAFAEGLEKARSEGRRQETQAGEEGHAGQEARAGGHAQDRRFCAVCIGPSCAGAWREYGERICALLGADRQRAIMAEEYSADGLTEAVLKDWIQEGEKK